MHILYILVLFLCAGASVRARVDMVQSDVEELRKHPMISHNMSEIQLQWIVIEEWSNLVGKCPELDPAANIHAVFDTSLVGTDVLAWASHTILLEDGVWIPSIATYDYMGHDFIIGVNPEPVNGWHSGTNCDDIGWRYDLRTVLRHEILHGIGIGSSITENGVGHTSSGVCYPRHYDTLIEDSDGNTVVDGCTLSDIKGKNVYINGVKLFNPAQFQRGSSLSHHVYAGHLMFYMLPPRKCLSIGNYEAKILDRMGLRCSGFELSGQQQIYPSLALSLLSFLCCLIAVSLA